MGFFSRLFGEKGSPEPIADLPGPGTYMVDVAGESHYQEALEVICGGKTEDSQRKEVRAVLIHEDSNLYDKNAIRVDIDGKTVGYMERDNAKKYREELKNAGHPGITAVCRAIIVGGWYRGKDDFGYFGVKLDLPTQD